MTAQGVEARPAYRTRRYWIRLLVVFAVTLVVVAVIFPFAGGVVFMQRLTHPPCSPGGNPGSFNPQYEDVAFTSTNGLQQQGYFMPGTNGATIIVIPAYSNGRGGDLHYAQVFNAAGFNVMTLNSRACTTRAMMSLGYQEVEDVQAAYRYLETRPDVDANRVGLHGFSSAGATSIMSAARMPEIRSVSAEGGYHDYAVEMGWEDQNLSLLYRPFQWGALVAYRVITGDDLRELSPYNMIDQLGTRPLLLIYGSLEVTLPGARKMLARAQANGEPAELWVVEGADHGGYMTVAYEEFVRRVVAFHRNALLG